MRPLDQTVDSLSETDSSALIMETIPRITHYLRSEIRRHRGPGFSIPQFRTLFFLSRNQGASLSDVAAHIGLTLPSTSKLVDGLVERNMVVRETSLLDRRCLTLSLTPNGRRALASAH
ncbi:MAG TPA: MarR family winged helix-turn-helix transcriptional regulator, partial [Dehalococcoidia bacterium]|nr:MarR family winged helix-turn-helix transcriptional regulator [Dehalococcoidia bacterium]